MRNLVRVLKAISDENRLKIIKFLEKRELCVCELQHLLLLSQPAVSHHLKVLYDAGLIDSSKDGLFVNYKLSRDIDENTAEVRDALLKTLDEDKIVKEDLDKLETVNRDEILAREK